MLHVQNSVTLAYDFATKAALDNVVSSILCGVGK